MKHKLKRIITLTILIIINFVLQSTVFGFHSLGTVTPNLLLILTMSFGLMRGRKEGLLVGAFCGLLVDTFFSNILGPYMLLYMFIGYINGVFHRNYMIEDVLLPFIVIIVDDFLFNTLIYIVSFLLKNKTDYGQYVLHVILPEMLCTALLTVIIYKLYVFINKRLKEDE